MQIRWFVSSSLAILNVIVQMASGKGGLYTSNAYILINARWAQTKAAHPLIMPRLWAHSAAHAWLGTVCVPDLCAARGWNVSLHGGSTSVPCRTVSKHWETVLNDETDGKGVAQLLWWGRSPWDTSWVKCMGQGPARSGKGQEKSWSWLSPCVSQPPMGWCPTLAWAHPCYLRGDRFEEGIDKSIHSYLKKKMPLKS